MLLQAADLRMTHSHRTTTAPTRPVLSLALSLLAALCVISPGTALSAPPPGHPSPGAAMQIMRHGTEAARGPVHTGVALDAVDANEYTYIEVDEAGTSYWIATARMKVMRGDMVQFEEGVRMEQFHSKLLKRTFPSVMFVGAVSTKSGTH